MDAPPCIFHFSALKQSMAPNQVVQGVQVRAPAVFLVSEASKSQKFLDLSDIS